MKRTKSAAVPPAPVPEDDRARVFERPDGYYWRSEDRRKEYGPFDTLRAATEDMQAGGGLDSDYEPGESIAEAEAEVGMADWIDPETGEPAEESIPRTEDH